MREFGERAQSLRRKLKAQALLVTRGADGELYRLLDHVIDSHVPVLTTIEDRLEHLSIQAGRGGREHGDIHRVVLLRRALVRVRRALAPQRDVIGALSRREHEFISQKSLFYFREMERLGALVPERLRCRK